MRIIILIAVLYAIAILVPVASVSSAHDPSGPAPAPVDSVQVPC